MTSMPPEERIGSHVKRAEQALLAAKNAALKPAAVTVPQYAALLWLSEKPGISAAALARLCGVTPPTMNTVLKNLRERGLIERTPHEWHRNVLETRLTEEGRAAMELADAGAVRVERALATAFSAKEREQLISLLGRCAEALDAQR
ncbi:MULTISPECIES: MarR family winged helix-turn-helix transcriptional regulator [unclassified Streptomyces]|uniref:MarR family winged helix-turn-helix transcriptional regulator n=1 Tax=unclassified Streptomyces TaxID=2593676 RepID=UPI00224E5BF7|nr:MULTISPECIES: MarR family transcriptional regulator [unclassified Streptomyces]MCX4627808.1 MarR family transcriptional regulator [Streptomyces sp. NBC_01443]WSW43899.1 MarR family transcriptional regulator [Streptomyces sp. NBC_01001]